MSYAFDAAGSIIQKSDVADTLDYIMGPTHTVTLLTQGATARSLMYDANGNFALGVDEPNVVWSSYNKPTQLAKSAITYNFMYGPDRRRFQKQRNTETTHYVGSRFERRFGGAAEVFRSVIYANGKAIMVREDGAGGTTHRYLHRDHLGSVTAITEESTGNVMERLSYDAWGKRRIASTWAAGAVTATDHRGYTGHEHLDDIGIIHMNGRIYSPSLGRMLSPDPVTQSPNNVQNYNRYSYAFNNPLSNVDPSGYVCHSYGENGTIVNDPLLTSTNAKRSGIKTTGCPGSDAGFYYQDGSYSQTFDPVLDSPLVAMGDAELTLGGLPNLSFSIGNANFWLSTGLTVEAEVLVATLLANAIDGLYNDILATLSKSVSVELAILSGVPSAGYMSYGRVSNVLEVFTEKINSDNLSAFDTAVAFGHELVHVADDANGVWTGQSRINLNQTEAAAYIWGYQHINRKELTSYFKEKTLQNGFDKFLACKRGNTVYHVKCFNKM